MSIWNDADFAVAGARLFTPFDPALINPASYDLTVGSRFMLLKPNVGAFVVADTRKAGWSDEQNWDTFDLGVHYEIVLNPGDFVLAHTEQTFTVPRSVAVRVEGKSTLGRAGLIVHATAGWIDPGFCGQVTMELSNISSRPIILAPGDIIGQAAVYQLTAPALSPYSGSYQDSIGVRAGRRA